MSAALERAFPEDVGERRRPDGWQGSTQLVTGNPAPVNMLQANFPESAEYTIEFHLEGNQFPTIAGPSGPVGNQPIVAVAMVKWSVEGSTVTRLLNIVDGASISGVAQGVNVFAYDATTQVHVETSPFGVPYVVTAQVAKGARASNKQPPTLIPTQGTQLGRVLVNSGASADVPIPQGSGVISVYVTVHFAVSPEPASNAVFIEQNFVAIPFAAKAYDPRDFPDWVPLAPGVDTITCVNNSADPVIFSIQFGVDG